MKTPLFLLALLLTTPVFAKDIVSDLSAYLLKLEDGRGREIAYFEYETAQGTYNQVTDSIQQVTSLTNVSDTDRSSIIRDLRIQSADLNSRVALVRSSLTDYDFVADGTERKISKTEFVALFNNIMENCSAALVGENLHVTSSNDVVEIQDTNFSIQQMNQISDIEFRIKNISGSVDTYVTFDYYQNEWVVLSQEYQTVVGPRITNFGIFEFMAPLLGGGSQTKLSCEVNNLKAFSTK